MNVILEWVGHLCCPPAGWDTGALLFAKAMLGLRASYICNLITWRSVESNCLRSSDQLLQSVPFTRTGTGKKGFYLFGIHST